MFFFSYNESFLYFSTSRANLVHSSSKSLSEKCGTSNKIDTVMISKYVGWFLGSTFLRKQLFL